MSNSDDRSTPSASSSSSDKDKKNATTSTTNAKMPALEEDWSIISSSSDIDDERSTTSSQEYPSSRISTNNSSATKLKVPQQRIDLEKSTNKLGNSANTISSPSTASSSGGAVTDSVISNGDDDDVYDDEDLVNVGSKIKFFENLNSFNDSIKQKSNQFYHDFARIHLDNYINDQQERNFEENMDDTIELTEPPSVLSTSKSDVVDQSPSTQRKESSPPVATKPTRHSRKLLVRGAEKIQSFLDDHADYLYYYLLIALVIGIAPAVYFTTDYYWFTPQPVKSVNSFDKINQYWTNLLYEDVSSKSIFGNKKQKVNKLVKYSNVMQAKFTDNVVPQFSKFTTDLQTFTTTKLIPQCEGAWLKTVDFGKSSSHNLGIWWEKSSILAGEYSASGYDKFSEYTSIGLYNLEKFYNSSSRYSQIWGKNIIAGSNDLYSKFQQTAAKESEYLSQVFNSTLRNVAHYQKVKLGQGLNEVKSFWQSEAPKFKSTLDRNSVSIYKQGKKFADAIMERLTN